MNPHFKMTCVTVELSETLLNTLIAIGNNNERYKALTDQIATSDLTGVLSLNHDELLQYTEAWFEGWDNLQAYLETGDTRDVQYPDNELQDDLIIEGWLRPLLNLYYIAVQRVQGYSEYKAE